MIGFKPSKRNERVSEKDAYGPETLVDEPSRLREDQ